MIALAFFALGSGIAGVFFAKRYGTLFNPPSLFALSFAVSSATAVIMSALAEVVELHAGFVDDPTSIAFIYSIGVVSFIAPWLFGSNPEGRIVKGIGDRRSSWAQLLLLICGTWFFLLITFAMLGGIPLLQMLTSEYSIVDHLANLQELSPGLMMINLAVAIVLSLYVASVSADRRNYRVSRGVLWVAIVTLIVASMWQGNRQLLLLFLFVVFARLFVKLTAHRSANNRRKLRRARLYVLAAAVCFVVFFVAVNYIRLASLGLFSGPFELLLYASWPVYNMVKIATTVGLEGGGGPYYIWTELIPARLGGKQQVVEMAPLLFEPTSPSGYFAYWYLDFGLMGVIVSATLLSVFSLKAFKGAARNEYGMRRYLLILWCCATASIYNHFISLAFFWIPLALLTIVSRFGFRYSRLHSAV